MKALGPRKSRGRDSLTFRSAMMNVKRPDRTLRSFSISILTRNVLPETNHFDYCLILSLLFKEALHYRRKPNVLFI